LRAVIIASSLVTRTISSMTERFSALGTKPAPIPWMRWYAGGSPDWRNCQTAGACKRREYGPEQKPTSATNCLDIAAIRDAFAREGGAFPGRMPAGGTSAGVPQLEGEDHVMSCLGRSRNTPLARGEMKR
jgi:hypothetical protein